MTIFVYTIILTIKLGVLAGIVAHFDTQLCKKRQQRALRGQFARDVYGDITAGL